MNKVPGLSRDAFEAYELLTVPVWVFARDSLRVLAVNQAALTWLGYERETLLQMTVLDIRPATERARFLASIRGFDGSNTDAGIWTIIAGSGAQFRVEFGWTKVLFDEQEAIVASIRDMTHIFQERATSLSLSSSLASMRERMVLHEEQFRRLFESVPGKMLALLPDGFVITGVTDEYAKAVSRTREDLIGRQLFDAFPDDPDEPEADGSRNLQASLNRVMTLHVTDVMNIQRYPVLMPDGHFEERYWLSLNKPVLDDAGKLLFIIHRVEDVTGLLRTADAQSKAAGIENGLAMASGQPGGYAPVAEMSAALTALQNREARLRAAESLLELGAWEFDLASERFSWSPRVFDVYGLATEQLPVSLEGYVANVHPDDREQMLARYREFERERAPNLVFEHRIVRANGSVAYVRGVGARHAIEGREVILGYVQDITEIKHAEHQLFEAARLQRRAGYMARLGTWQLELNPQRIVWSAETAAMHDEPEGTSPSLEESIRYYAPQYRDLVKEMVDACVSKGKPFDEVLQLTTSKGRCIWVRAIGEPVYGPHGQVVAAEGAFQDISEFIAARDLSEDLSRRLRQTLERISDAFFLLDDQWRFTFLNNQAEVVLHRPREELLG